MRRILLFLFFVAAFINFMGPIVDPDFPFHLKTGEYIWQNNRIPQDDPFSFYGQGSITDRERFTLSQYWIAQILFYKLYSVAGPVGIILLRASVFSVFIVLLWAILRQRGFYSSLLVTTLTAIMLRSVCTDRPQFFSFLFTLLIVLLFERFRKNSESFTPLIFIPPLMLVWANMHAGFVFGIAIIVIYALSEASKLFVNKRAFGCPLDKKSVLALSATALVAILFSYVNPVFNEQILTTFESHVDPDYVNLIYGINREYISPVQEMRIYFGNRLSAMIFFSLFGFVSIITLLNLVRTKSADVTSVALILFSSIASFSAVRYIPFFLAVALPLSREFTFFENSSLPAKFKKYKFIYVLFVVFYMYAIFFGLRDYSRIFSHNISEYPEKAADFLLHNNMRANIFNQFNKGSYLLWRLYPHYRLFNDTRFIDLEAVKDTDAIANASAHRGQPVDISLAVVLSDLVPETLGRIKIKNKEGLISPINSVPLWKKLLKDHNIDLIVHEACDQFTKAIYPLILGLLNDDEWKLIYLDGKMLIFVRNDEKYSEVIRKYELKKELVYDQIILEAIPLVSRAPANSAPYSSLCLAYLMKGEDEKAKKMIEAALDLNKNDIVASFGKEYLALKHRSEDHVGKRL